MSVITIRGVEVKFPFKPYDLQKNYMEKVIECLQTEHDGVLESPTGTGKTLSLLCSTLAWLELKKSYLQVRPQATSSNHSNNCFQSLHGMFDKSDGKSGRSFLGLPTIIYASRTHSQLSQAMRELKRTAYSYMKAYVLGSREQMCIHPELTTESNADLLRQMCQLKVASRSCIYYNRVEQKKNDPVIRELSVIDIEDMLKLGNCHKFCPYFMAKELKREADIIFMPYNYLLDPLIRKVLGIDLTNNVVILDEAHNIERICEESASFQVKSSDIALAIEEVTAVMKMLSSDTMDIPEGPRDFSSEDLCILKQMLLDFEKELDNIELKHDSLEGTSFDGSFIFDLLNNAGIKEDNCQSIITLLTNVTQYLNVISNGPYARKGVGLQMFEKFLSIIFIRTTEAFKQKVKKCYKVHIIEEQSKKKKSGNWISKASAKSGGRILSYWCFSPAFGMNMLLDTGVKCVIMTSGTLAPMKPLISELGVNAPICLENPHIVKKDQVCVNIVSSGPDQEPLNCNYQNRDNVKYIASVGRSILNLIRVIPDGVLIFFPSYPIMQNFQQHWQEIGLWTSINQQKMVYVEPKDKTAFTTAMEEYYKKISDPSFKGAIFMGVCRGKVSEGVDFMDANGRAVIVIGLPYPPLRDPKIILKRKYLDMCNTIDKEYLRGDDWYSLEASRAVNQAIGRVIRHSNDYGAIILLDTRFNNYRIKNQMSLWLREHIKIITNFAEIMKDLKLFFKNAEKNFPVNPPESMIEERIKLDIANKKSNFDFNTSSASCSNLLCSTSTQDEVVIHKRSLKEHADNSFKRRRICIIPNRSNPEYDHNTTPEEYIMTVKRSLDTASLKTFFDGLRIYNESSNLNELINTMNNIFKTQDHLRYLISGLNPYIKNHHREDFDKFCKNIG